LLSAAATFLIARERQSTKLAREILGLLVKDATGNIYERGLDELSKIGVEVVTAQECISAIEGYLLLLSYLAASFLSLPQRCQLGSKQLLFLYHLLLNPSLVPEQIVMA
jgi:hypothetical protein